MGKGARIRMRNLEKIVPQNTEDSVLSRFRRFVSNIGIWSQDEVFCYTEKDAEKYELKSENGNLVLFSGGVKDTLNEIGNVDTAYRPSLTVFGRLKVDFLIVVYKHKEGKFVTKTYDPVLNVLATKVIDYEIESIGACGNVNNKICLVTKNSDGRFVQYYDVDSATGNWDGPRNKKEVPAKFQDAFLTLDDGADPVIFARNQTGTVFVGSATDLMPRNIDLSKSAKPLFRTIYGRNVDYYSAFFSDGNKIYYTKFSTAYNFAPLQEIASFSSEIKSIQVAEQRFTLGPRPVIGFDVFATDGQSVNKVSFGIEANGIAKTSTIKTECVAHCSFPTTQFLTTAQIQSTAESTTIELSSTPRYITTGFTSRIQSTASSTTTWLSSTVLSSMLSTAATLFTSVLSTTPSPATHGPTTEASTTNTNNPISTEPTSQYDYRPAVGGAVGVLFFFASVTAYCVCRSIAKSRNARERANETLPLTQIDSSGASVISINQNTESVRT